MEDLVSTNTGNLSVLDNLAAQAQMFVQNACMNLLHLGRVLCEAKPLVQHGQWEEWVKTNTSMSKRQAEQCMKAYREFGLNQQIAALGTTKILKLLPLSEEERDAVLSDENVSSMSTREFEEAIRQQKSKMMKEIEKERNARVAAEQRAREAENRPAKEDPELNRKIKLLEEQEQIRIRQVRDLERDVKERDEIIQEQQQDYNRIQEELLNTKSAIAKGDAERTPADQLTAEAFAAAVRTFIGTCARMPHMTATFSVMQEEERNSYDELLHTIESWAAESRKALNTIAMEGTVIDCE